MIVSTIIVPQINVNETTVYVVEWLVSDGASVKAGESVVAVETSKAVVEVEAEADGYLRQGADVGVEVAIGATVGWIDAKPESAAVADVADVLPTLGEQQVKATAKAREFAAQHNIDLSILPKRGIITEDDVRKTVTKPGPVGSGVATPLNPTQKAAMNIVMRSAQEQAATCMLGEADVTDSLVFLEELSQQKGSISNYTLTDLLIHQTARSLKEFPRLNSTLVAEGLTEHSNIHVGVTMEVEGQLYMAVLQDAHRLSIGEIAKQRMAVLLDMLRGKGHDAVTRRGTFSVTVLDQPAVHHQVPIIFPDQAGIFGVGGVRREIRLGSDGERPEVRSVVGLCLSYDHRFINGHYAARFLKAISARLVEPQGLNDV